MMDFDRLTDWLLACIAEDERAAVGSGTVGWLTFRKPDGSMRYTAVGSLAGSGQDSDWIVDGVAREDVAAAQIIYSEDQRLAECEAKRRIVEWHQNWPVLIEQRPTLDTANDLDSVTVRLSQQIAWLTEGEYRTRFGAEPPTGPILRMLALPYADRPGYREEWRP